MIGGSFTVATSDDPRFISGVSYPLTIDDSTVELTIVETASATGIPATSTAPSVAIGDAPTETPASTVAAPTEQALPAGSTPATA
jgi:hypothetical protein